MDINISFESLLSEMDEIQIKGGLQDSPMVTNEKCNCGCTDNNCNKFDGCYNEKCGCTGIRYNTTVCGVIRKTQNCL